MDGENAPLPCRLSSKASNSSSLIASEAGFGGDGAAATTAAIGWSFSAAFSLT